jgi:hypothetical protein
MARRVTARAAGIVNHHDGGPAGWRQQIQRHGNHGREFAVVEQKA